MTKKVKEALEQKLNAEKESLEKELSSFSKEDSNLKGDWATKFPKFDGGDMESEADEVQEYEKLLSVERSLEKRLKDVNLAIEKIKKGTYGICDKCGKKIDAKRLEACPEARFCIKCN